MAERLKQSILQMTELHRKLGQIIRKVALSDEHFIVEKGGLPVVVMMSMREYENLTGEMRDKLLKDLVRALGPEAERQGLTEEQLIAELKEDRRALYQEKYGRPGD